MKTSMKWLCFSSMIVFVGCEYRVHLPTAPVNGTLLPKTLVMRIGERKRAMSEPLFSLKQPIFPSALLKTSNDRVLEVELGISKHAWLRAVKPGKASILYYPYNVSESRYSHVIVTD